MEDFGCRKLLSDRLSASKIPFFSRERQSSKENAGAPPHPAERSHPEPTKSEALKGTASHADAAQSLLDPQSEAAADPSHPAAEETLRGHSSEELFIEHNEVNGLTERLHSPAGPQASNLSDAAHSNGEVSGSRPGEGNSQETEIKAPSQASLQTGPPAVRHEKWREPAAEATLVSRSWGNENTGKDSNSHSLAALPDSEADEASEAAGLISAEGDPQSANEAEAIPEASSSTTAGKVTATAISHDISESAAEIGQHSARFSNLVTSLPQAPTGDTEQSMQAITKAAKEALDDEAERLAGIIPQEEAVVEPILSLRPEQAHRKLDASIDDASLLETSAVALSEKGQQQEEADLTSSRQDDARVMPVESEMLQPSEASPARDDSSGTATRSASAIGDMLRSMQKEEWDAG